MFILRFISKLIFWDYQRGTWQHEFLCLAYIAALTFIPTNSNGWFTEGETIELSDNTTITLYRHNTTLYLSWSGDSQEYSFDALLEFVEKRFGEDTELLPYDEEGAKRYRIIPRRLQ